MAPHVTTKVLQITNKHFIKSREAIVTRLFLHYIEMRGLVGHCCRIYCLSPRLVSKVGCGCDNDLKFKFNVLLVLC